jgi:hypothetical protein
MIEAAIEAILNIAAIIIGVAGIWTFLGALVAKDMDGLSLGHWQRKGEPESWS